MSGNGQGPVRRPSFFGSKSTNRRKSAQGLFAFGVVVCLTLTGRWMLASMAKSHERPPAEAEPTSVRVVQLHDEVITPGVRYSALVKELQKAEISFRVPGNVELVHQVPGPGGRLRAVHEGDVLEGGTVLATLDPSDYRRERDVAAGRLATAKARLAQAQSDAELAAIEFRRAEQLVRRNAMSTSEQDTARAKLRGSSAAEDAARREVQTAEVELEKAQANLDYCTITVPFEAGTIAARYIEKAERVTANQRAFLVVDVTSVVIAFFVPDTMVGQLAIGQTVDVRTDALPDERFTGVIHKIASTADPATRTYPIEVRVDQPRGLRPGMVAHVYFRHDERAYLLPMTAVAAGNTPKAFTVYRVAEEHGQIIAHRVPSVLEAVVDNRVAVRVGSAESLKPGDRIVTTGVHRLHDGEIVQIVE